MADRCRWPVGKRLRDGDVPGTAAAGERAGHIETDGTVVQEIDGVPVLRGSAFEILPGAH